MDDDLPKADADVLQASARTPLPSTAFTQDVFSAVPCERGVLTRIVSAVADHLWQRRRFGEPLNEQSYPQDIFSLPINSLGLDRTIAADSDRAFRLAFGSMSSFLLNRYHPVFHQIAQICIRSCERRKKINNLRRNLSQYCFLHNLIDGFWWHEAVIISLPSD